MTENSVTQQAEQLDKTKSEPMKKLAALLAAAALFAGAFTTAVAQTTSVSSNAPVKVTLSSYVANQYLGFGAGAVLSKDPVVQTSLTASFSNGIYLNVWNSRSLRGRWNNQSLGNEIDYGIGWNGLIAPKLRLNIGITYFDEPRIGRFGAGDILYSRISLTREFEFANVTAGFENYVTMPKSGFQGGNLFTLGVSKRASFWEDRIAVRASVAGVYDSGTPGSKPGFLLRGNAGADLKVNENVTVNAIGVNWYLPTEAHGTKRDAMVYSGVTINF